MRLEAAEVDNDARDRLFAACRDMDGKWERAAVSLYRRWSPKHCMADDTDVVGEVAGAAEEIAPIAARLNYLVRQAASARAPGLERAPWRPPD